MYSRVPVYASHLAPQQVSHLHNAHNAHMLCNTFPAALPFYWHCRQESIFIIEMCIEFSTGGIDADELSAPPFGQSCISPCNCKNCLLYSLPPSPESSVSFRGSLSLCISYTNRSSLFYILSVLYLRIPVDVLWLSVAYSCIAKE